MRHLTLVINSALKVNVLGYYCQLVQYYISNTLFGEDRSAFPGAISRWVFFSHVPYSKENNVKVMQFSFG